MRELTEWKSGDSEGITFSRSEASQIRAFIAKAIGMDDFELACKIADYKRSLGESK
jgi:hypothetical protein